LQVKLCDPCLSALYVPWCKKALYKYSSFPFLSFPLLSWCRRVALWSRVTAQYFLLVQMWMFPPPSIRCNMFCYDVGAIVFYIFWFTWDVFVTKYSLKSVTNIGVQCNCRSYLYDCYWGSNSPTVFTSACDSILDIYNHMWCLDRCCLTDWLHVSAIHVHCCYCISKLCKLWLAVTSRCINQLWCFS